MIKKLVLVLLLFSGPVFCQDFTLKESETLESFGIPISELDLEDELTQSRISYILKKEKKRKRKKSVGTIFTTLGALSITGGIIGVLGIDDSTSENDPNEGAAYQGLIGSMVIATGVIESAIGIPLLVGTKREKAERDKFIKMLNPNWAE